MASTVIGIDIGGTFTDFIRWHKNEISTYKLLSIPANPARAVLEGLSVLLKDLDGKNTTIVHGSTVATNSLLERKGAKTALVTTEGFKDVIEIGRQNREKLYDLKAKKVPPLVPRELRFEVKERMDFRGEVLKSPETDELRELRKKLEALSVESVAICLLFSYINPEHEKMVYEELKNLKIPLSVSSKILPEYREFERTSTVVANAFVAPKMNNYLKELTEDEKGEAYPWKLRILQSNGGSIEGSLARREPVRTVLSGPAGGVVAAEYMASLAGYEKIITFDMGGTSTDVSLCDGEITLTTEGEVGGYPVRVPLIDIHTVGAGGGSIAFLDRGGMLRVGPESSGADPGPICYGRGGENPTVTDAQFILGRIDSEYFWGGKLSLDLEKTERVFQKLAGKLGISKVELACGIIEIANSSMQKALKVISLERGYDPADFTLVCFGGAGPLHACDLAGSLSISRIMVPKNAGVLSAFGMVVADIVRDYSKTVALKVSEENRGNIELALRELEGKAINTLSCEKRGDIKIEKFLDLRYEGQSYELTVPYEGDFQENFHELHLRRYHHDYRDKPVEAVNVRVKIKVRTEKPELIREEKKELGTEKAPVKREKVFWGEYIETPVFQREFLLPGMKMEGPALVFEKNSTLVIPPGFYGEVDGFENIILEEQK